MLPLSEWFGFPEYALAIAVCAAASAVYLSASAAKCFASVAFAAGVASLTRRLTSRLLRTPELVCAAIGLAIASSAAAPMRRRRKRFMTSTFPVRSVLLCDANIEFGGA